MYFLTSWARDKCPLSTTGIERVTTVYSQFHWNICEERHTQHQRTQGPHVWDLINVTNSEKFITWESRFSTSGDKSLARCFENVGRRRSEQRKPMGHNEHQVYVSHTELVEQDHRKNIGGSRDRLGHIHSS